MFDRDGKEYCNKCFEENKREYETLVEYIERSPNHTILDIITETKLSMKTINRFIEDGSVSYVKEKSDI